jgi:hypothetical protein
MSMTETGTTMANGDGLAPPSRPVAAIPDDVVEGLMAKVQAEGLELLGEDGVLV